MAFYQCSSSLSASPNVTPLIDVLLVLLIIFMVIVPVTPHGLKAAVPELSPPNVPETAPIVIHVLPRRGGGVTYRVDAQSFELAGLFRMLTQASARSARPELLVAGDERLDYQPIAETIATAHRAGFHEVGLMHEPKP